jgi:hypothetical protein
LYEKKFGGICLKNRTPEDKNYNTFNKDILWTKEELGLVGPDGTSNKAPVLIFLSKGKGPGPDSLIDKLVHTDENMRYSIFRRVWQIFNGQQELTDSEKSGKLMLLSKTGDQYPDSNDIRPILI